MSTKQATADFIQDQLASLKGVAVRKMFGEYALYCAGKVVGLICDDTLFIKITDQGRAFVGKQYREGMPYPGAKPSMKISEERLEDRAWLSKLVQITAEDLPTPKPKKRKKERG